MTAPILTPPPPPYFKDGGHHNNDIDDFPPSYHSTEAARIVRNLKLGRSRHAQLDDYDLEAARSALESEIRLRGMEEHKQPVTRKQKRSRGRKLSPGCFVAWCFVVIVVVVVLSGAAGAMS